MPLELNGQAYNLTDEENRKYSKQMIFRAGKQYISSPTDPEMPKVQVAPVHIPTSYNHSEIVDNQRRSIGVMRYYDAKNEGQSDSGKAILNYTPRYIGIGHRGYMACDDPERNFFLDNHPLNEKVHADSTHPNYKSGVETLLSTYSRVDRAIAALDSQRLAAKLMTDLLDESMYGVDRLRATAMVIVNESTVRKMTHKLWDSGNMEEPALRAEMVRLSQLYPESVTEILAMQVTDMAEEINKFKAAGIITLSTDNVWIFNDKKPVSLVSVTPLQDPVHALVMYFKNVDNFGNKFKAISKKYKESLIPA